LSYIFDFEVVQKMKSLKREAGFAPLFDEANGFIFFFEI